MKNVNIMVIFIFALSLMAAYSVYKTFILPLVVAILLTMATYNLTKALSIKLNSRQLSSFFATMLLTILIFAPIIYLATIGVGYVVDLTNDDVKYMIEEILKIVGKFPYGDEISLELFQQQENILAFFKDYASYLSTAGNAGFGFIKNIFFVVVFYFIINVYSEKVFNFLQSLLPVSKTKSIEITQSISSTMEVVFYSIIITAIFEGILFGIFIQLYGLNGLFFGIIYGFASLIPIIGGAIVWVPVSLYVYNHFGVTPAIEVLSYSLIVISFLADTIIKPMIIKYIQEDMLKKVNEINEILIFFSIIAGMGSYGFWGMILGPAITAFLIAMTRLYIESNEKIVFTKEENCL